MRGSRLTVAALVVAATLGTAAETAAGAAHWSPPFAVSGLGRAWGPQVLAGPAGTTILRRDSGTDAVWMRRVGPDGTLGPDRQVSPSDQTMEGWTAAGNRLGGAVVVWEVFDDGHVLRGRRIDRRGRLGPVRDIARRQTLDDPGPSLGVDARGNAWIAWSDIRAESVQPKGWLIKGATVHLRRWHADGRLGPQVDLPATGELRRSPVVAVAPSGRTALAWWQGDVSTMALKGAAIASDGVVGPMREIDSPRRRTSFDGDGLRLAIEPGGDTTFAWVSRAGVQEPALLARHLTADGELGAVRQLASGVYHLSPPVVDRLGRTTLAWAGGIASIASVNPVSVHALRLEAGARAASWRLSAPGVQSSYPALAVDRAGRVMAVWGARHEDGSPAWEAKWGIQGRTISPTGSLGRVLTVSEPARHVNDMDIALAVDVRGTATAAWSRSWRPHSRSGYTKVLASRLLARCQSIRLRGMVSTTSRRHYQGNVRGLRLRVRSRDAVDLAVRRVELSYRPSGGGAIRSVGLRRAAASARGRHVRIVIPARLRGALPAGKHVRVRMRLRARPYASGCRYQRSRTVDATARVGWVVVR